MASHASDLQAPTPKSEAKSYMEGSKAQVLSCTLLRWTLGKTRIPQGTRLKSSSTKAIQRLQGDCLPNLKTGMPEPYILLVLFIAQTLNLVSP